MINKLYNFIDTNNEFSYLIDILNENIKLESKSIRVLEKSTITLLVTKLENFLENKTSQWFEVLKSDPLNTCYNLSDIIKKEIIKDTTDKIYNDLKKGVITSKNKNKLNNLQILIEEFYPLNKLDVDFKIRLGSHGGNEIKSLLKKIGIENIFKSIEEHENSKNDNEVVENINLTTKIDYEGNINKLINYRNNIIHEDILNFISYTDLNQFITSVNLLCEVVERYINNLQSSGGEVDEIKIQTSTISK